MFAKPRSVWTWHTVFYGVIILILSYFTYVYNYTYPPALFWDENYFLSSAQKYLTGTFFMEPHPPLAKLFIALGEHIVNANPDDWAFIGTDYAQTLSPGFSFAGYRLFPVLFAWGGALVFFGILLLLTRKALLAALFSFLYVFDNALIVHFRGAMLDSTMVFFVLLTILAFLLLLEYSPLPSPSPKGVVPHRGEGKRFKWAAIFFGLALAATAATKVLGLIVLLLVPVLLWSLRANRPHLWTFLRYGGISSLLLYCAIWQIHFSLATKINPELPDAGYYQASESYKRILTEGGQNSILSFPVMLRDSWNFLSHYEAGVPVLDLCKPDENGSPWFMWPVGARSINYRWETPDGDAYQYLYLQANPVVWGLGFLGVLASIGFLLSTFLLNVRLKYRFELTVFLGMYLAYMFVMSQVSRVMYLYHYFIPLILSFILLAIVLMQIKHIGILSLTDHRKKGVAMVMGILIFLAFQAYRPFTYYEPIGDRAVSNRSLLQLWDLRCINCSRDNPLVRPR